MLYLQREGFMTYQKVTGPLMANSHPGSYCGQDAYSDMLVTEGMNELFISGVGSVQGFGSGKCAEAARLQGRYRSYFKRGG